MDRKYAFEQIYAKNIWNNGLNEIPRSGPGSSLKNTRQYRDYLDKFVKENNIRSIVDIGCGDLTWFPLTDAFKTTNYTGIDIVPMLIEEHSKRYPQHTFLCLDCVEEEIPSGDLVVIRDVLFHLEIKDIQLIFEKLKCKYLFVTSCRNRINKDGFNAYRYHEINLQEEPFKMNNFVDSFSEKEFNRDVLVYQFLSQ